MIILDRREWMSISGQPACRHGGKYAYPYRSDNKQVDITVNLNLRVRLETLDGRGKATCAMREREWGLG